MHLNPELALAVLAASLGFVLKSSLAFAICWTVSRLLQSPQKRFTLWLSFLLGAVFYWCFLAAELFGFHSLASTAFVLDPGSQTSPIPAIRTWQLPASCAGALAWSIGVACLLYVVTVTWLLASAVRNQLRLQWVLRFTTAPINAIRDRFMPIAQQLGISRCRLLVLAGLTSPATVGFLRPVILLPDMDALPLASDGDDAELTDILRHELHHVRRCDYLWSSLASSCRAILFFHPGMTFAMRRMQFERELACDFAVVAQSPHRRVEYAETLVRFARRELDQHHASWGMEFAASSTPFQARLRSILTPSTQIPRWWMFAKSAFSAALFFLLLAVLPLLTIALHLQRELHGLVSQTSVQSTSTAARHRAPRLRKVHALTAKTDPGLKDAQSRSLQTALRSPYYVEESSVRLGEPDGDSGDHTRSVSPVDPPIAPDDSAPPSGLPRRAPPQLPTVTSVIVNAARGVGRIGDHDHGRDIH